MPKKILQLICILFVGVVAHAQIEQPATNALAGLNVGADQKEAVKIHDSIYQAIGFGNTFLVTTADGNVIIDTSSTLNATRHRKLLQAVSTAPIKYIILTHSHGDHNGGVKAWKQAGTNVIAQKNHLEFQHYLARLQRFYALRNSAQFSFPTPPTGNWPGNYGAEIEPNILFDEKYEFTLGGTKFQIFHTPGETPDHLTVWIPQYKAAFIGDNYYQSFPNLYTLRGTQPRWALEYVASLNQVLALKPEIVIPSHGNAIHGNEEITRKLTQYRDAILYVHDETVKGMNAGQDVWTLMNEIKLPKALEVGEGYGKLSWSVRGIYEGYVGWFDSQPTTMYETPQNKIYPDLIKAAGGAAVLANLAQTRIASGKELEALHFTEIILAVEPKHKQALTIQLQALQILLGKCTNSNERGWLNYFIKATTEQLK